MAECLHDWQPRASGIKEACSKCGAARVIDPNGCSHEWILRPSGIKYGCSKCGVAKVVLDVQDVQKTQETENPL